MKLAKGVGRKISRRSQ